MNRTTTSPLPRVLASRARSEALTAALAAFLATSPLVAPTSTSKDHS
jgi:hypothetical protein